MVIGFNVEEFVYRQHIMEFAQSSTDLTVCWVTVVHTPVTNDLDYIENIRKMLVIRFIRETYLRFYIILPKGIMG